MSCRLNSKLVWIFEFLSLLVELLKSNLLGEESASSLLLSKLPIWSCLFFRLTDINSAEDTDLIDVCLLFRLNELKRPADLRFKCLSPILTLIDCEMESFWDIWSPKLLSLTFYTSPKPRFYLVPSDSHLTEVKLLALCEGPNPLLSVPAWFWMFCSELRNLKLLAVTARCGTCLKEAMHSSLPSVDYFLRSYSLFKCLSFTSSG